MSPSNLGVGSGVRILKPSRDTALALESTLGAEDRPAEPTPGGGVEDLQLKRQVADAAERTRHRYGGRPLVAIALATHEPPIDLFERLVESITSQSHPGWICVLRDDGSAPDRLRAVRTLIAGDDRFVFSSSSQRAGVRGNFERALAAIGPSVDLVALADQSDRWHPEKLSRLIRTVGEGPHLAYSDVRVVDLDLRPLSDGLYVRRREDSLTIDDLAGASLVPGSASLFRRELLELALPFPRDVAVRHDQWLALVALEARGITFTDDVLTEHCATDPHRARALIERAFNGAGRHRGPRLRRRNRSAAANGANARQLITAVRERCAGAAMSSDARRGTEMAIRVEGLTKRFPIPTAEPQTLAGRLLHPLRRLNRDALTALDDVSFEVARGEFFGIAGGNGSGKTTLLQVLANVYKADEGKVFIAPRVAPIISLGIGFHPDLPARPNVLMTAELLGIPEETARRRLSEVLSFAELEEFADLKLRNYSSGMRVRLAFATVMLVDADVLLFDEILAVGDSAFKDRAREAFDELRNDKTVVLVTHQMSHLLSYCDRALLLNRGRIEVVGDPAEVARRYAELALESHGERTDLPPGDLTAPAKPRAEILDVWISDGQGAPTTSVAPSHDILLHATIVASAPIREPGLRFEIRRRGAARMFAPPTLPLGVDHARRLRAGARLDIETTIENKLAPGPYTAVCTVTANRDGRERSVSAARTTDFVVAAGPEETRGVVSLEHTVRVKRAGRSQPPGGTGRG